MTSLAPRLSPLAAYSLGVTSSLLTLVARRLIFPSIGFEGWYLLFSGAVIAVTWIAGLRPGLVTLGLIAVSDLALSASQNQTIDAGAWLLFILLAGLAAAAISHPYRFRTTTIEAANLRDGSNAKNTILLHREQEQHRETGAALNVSQGMFEQLVKSVEDYAIFMLNPEGIVVTWNLGAKRIKGYKDEEIIGQSFTRFYTPEDLATGKPLRGLKTAREEGHFEDEGWRVRKDGTRFWASVVITAIRDESGTLLGFAKVTRDNTQRRIAEQALQQAKNELEQRVIERSTANRELEAFSYSVSHDLRAPLRHLMGFSQALREDYADALDEEGKTYLKHIEESGQRMEGLIDELLKLSQLTTGPLEISEIDLSKVAHEIVAELEALNKDRKIEFIVGDTPPISGDLTLLRVVLYNLLENAVKFTMRTDTPVVEFGTSVQAGRVVYYVRDNGIGFDTKYADRLFGPFQRLHAREDFAGTGIGLATCQRILRRHGGRIWADANSGQGAKFFFTVGDASVD
jgi:PAS domain S-box-containing protein